MLGAGAASAAWATSGGGEASLPDGKADADAEADTDAEADADGDADPEGEAVALSVAVAPGEGTGVNDADGWVVSVGAAPGTGAKRRIPPRTSAAAAIPVSRPATIDSRGHMLARRVPVRTRGGRFARASDTMRPGWPDRATSFVHAYSPPC